MIIILYFSYICMFICHQIILTAGLSQQCYSQPNCVAGSEIDTPTDPPTPKDCCAGTNDGQSYADLDGVCSVSQCVGEKFSSFYYAYPKLTKRNHGPTNIFCASFFSMSQISMFLCYACSNILCMYSSWLCSSIL